MADVLKYKIHGVAEDHVPAVAEIDGVKTEVQVKCLLVEAVSSDGSMGHVFKVRNGNADDYPVGAELVATLSVTKPTAPAAAE
jgi:hypothetical protein